MDPQAGQQTTPASPSPAAPPASPPPAAPAAASPPPAPAPATPPAGSPPSASAGAGDRPAYVPEKFWDPEKGLKGEDFQKHLQSLETFHAEQSIKLRGIPEKPDGYQFKLPEGFKAPDGIELQLDGQLTKKLGEFAHRHGLTQEALEGLLVLDAERMATQQQELQRFQETELQKLGPQALDRLDAVKRAAISRGLPETVANKLLAVSEAADIDGLEKWLRGNLTPFNSAGRDAPRPGPSNEQLEAMAPADRLAFLRSAGQK